MTNIMSKIPRRPVSLGAICTNHRPADGLAPRFGRNTQDRPPLTLPVELRLSVAPDPQLQDVTHHGKRCSVTPEPTDPQLIGSVVRRSTSDIPSRSCLIVESGMVKTSHGRSPFGGIYCRDCAGMVTD